VLDGVAKRTIFGRGAVGYRDALRLLINLQVASTTIRYGPHPENVGDLRVPDHPTGLVVLLHGGFWLREYGRDTMDSLAAELVDHGFASWNIEYRRSGAGGSWPGSGHDVKSALDFISQIDEVRDTPVAVIGHSAGGYLALWLATRADLALTVGLAPITDLEAAATEGPGQEAATDLLSRGAPSVMTGERSDMFLLHGGDDQFVPAKHSTRLEGAARVEVIDDFGHFDLLDPSRSHWPLVLEALASTFS
jgi:acetyl esterase/lipase